MHYLIYSCLICCLLPVSAKVGGITFYTFDVAFLPLISLVLFKRITSNKSSEKSLEKFEILFILFVGVAAISTFLSVNIDASLVGLLLWLRFLLFYWTVKTVYTQASFPSSNYVLMIYASLIFLLTIGLIQFFVDDNFGVVAYYFGESLAETSKGFNSSRVSGTSINSNTYGMWIVLLVTTVLVRLLLVKSGKALNLCLLIASVFLIFASGSKTSFLHLSVTLLLSIIIINNQFGGGLTRTSIAGIGTLLLSTLFLMSPLGSTVLESFMDRIFDFESASYFQRTESVNGVVDLMNNIHYLIIGTGSHVYYETLESIGVYNTTYAEYVDVINKRAGIHNIFLNMLTSYGIVGVTLLFLSFALAIARVFKLYKYQSKSLQLVCGSIAVLAALVPAQLNAVVWSINFFPWMIFFVASLLGNLQREKAYR